MRNFQPDERIIKLLSELKTRGYLLYCASNSVYSTLKNTLIKKGFCEYIDFIISNEDVKYPKPSPEIYYRCLERANLSPYEVLICEDSHVGRLSALRSGCHLCPIIDQRDCTLDKVSQYIELAHEYNKKNNFVDLRWKNEINVIIPMAGRGSRFIDAGYTVPKPLIILKNTGKSMIETVIENLNIDGNYIFIVQKEFLDNHNLEEIIKKQTNKYHIIGIDYVTEGAACSVLLAEQFINNNNPLLIANCNEFLYSMKMILMREFKHFTVMKRNGHMF